MLERSEIDIALADLSLTFTRSEVCTARVKFTANCRCKCTANCKCKCTVQSTCTCTAQCTCKCTTQCTFTCTAMSFKGIFNNFGNKTNAAGNHECKKKKKLNELFTVISKVS